MLLDDTLTMGGTVASLRGYVENRGGKVVAASVMTAHPGAVDLAVKPPILAAIEKKHGPAMDTYWKEAFGYGIDKLTQGEAGHLKAAAVLTPSELASLQQDMKVSSAWMREELKRRREKRERR